VNDSTSQISPDWPTRWPKGSFSTWWTAGFIALLLVLGFFVFLVAGVAAGIWLIATHHQSELMAAAKNPASMTSAVFISSTVAQLIAEAVIVMLILVALPRLTHLSLRDLGFRALDASAIGYALLGAVGMVIVADIGSSLIDTLTHAVHPQLVEKVFEHLRAQSGGVAFFVAFAVVLQPIAEEMIFRVLFFNVALRYGGFWIGATFSGLLFGFAHVVTGGADIVSGLLLALGGVVLAWVYYRSRNVYASMISHGLFNAVSTAALYFAPKLAGG
jgi:membrane protease YdiL (CAAX protease family)